MEPMIQHIRYIHRLGHKLGKNDSWTDGQCKRIYGVYPEHMSRHQFADYVHLMRRSLKFLGSLNAIKEN